VDTAVFVLNNARMPASLTLDVRVQEQFRLPWWSGALWTVYIDCRNVTNQANVLWIDSNGRIGGELDDPSAYAIGRRTNVGLQIEF